LRRNEGSDGRFPECWGVRTPGGEAKQVKNCGGTSSSSIEGNGDGEGKQAEERNIGLTRGESMERKHGPPESHKREKARGIFSTRTKDLIFRIDAFT